MSLKEFSESAKALTKNPLGIIGLFIVLVYGFACLLLGAGLNDLTENQNWFLVLFVISFPAFILFTFFKLVTEHHKKLYAPSDYNDENNFHFDLLNNNVEDIQTTVSNTEKGKIIELESKNNELIKHKKKQERILKSYESKLKRKKIHNEKDKLLILKNMLLDKKSTKPDYNITMISEAGERELEDCIEFVINSKNIKEYLQKINFTVIFTENDKILKRLFSDNTKDHENYDVVSARFSNDGWFAITDNTIHLNNAMKKILEKEFREIKNKK